MSNSGSNSSIVKIDLYQRLPKDLVQPTCSGALISLLGTIFIIYLFYVEIISFMQLKTKTEVLIDVNNDGDKIRANFAIRFPKIPCSLLSVDVQDIIGSHHVDIQDNIKKHRLHAAGGEYDEYKPLVMKSPEDEDEDEEVIKDVKNNTDAKKNNPMQEFEMKQYQAIKEDVISKQGCKVEGFIMLNKVPGNIHFSTHAHQNFVSKLTSEGLYNFDLSYIIDIFRFGEKDYHDKLKVYLNDDQVLSPMETESKLLSDKNIYEFYLQIVPSTYRNIHGEDMFIYQYSHKSQHVIAVKEPPALYVRYDFSPISTVTTQYKESLIDFLVKICAIIGGVFTVLGIIDAIIHESMSSFIRKAHLGKLT